MLDRLRVSKASVWRSRPLWALLVSLFIVNIGVGIIVPVMPFYSLEVGATPAQIGLLFSVYSLAQFLSASLWGYLTDRIGARIVIVLGNVGLGVSLIAFGLADQLWLLFAARSFGGAMSGAAVPASLAYAGKATSTGERGAAMAMLGAGIGAGFIVGPALGGFLAVWGLAVPFLVSAGIILVAAVVAILVLPRSTSYYPEDEAQTEAGATSQAPVRAEGWFSPTRLIIGYFLLAVLLASLGDSYRQSTLALYTSDLFGMGGDSIGLMFTLMGLAYVLIQVLFAGRAVDRFGEPATLFAGLILNASGFALFLLATDFWTITGTICIQGAGMAFLHTSVPSMISKTAGSRSGTFMGFRTTLENAGRVFGPVWGTRAYEQSPTLPYITGGFIYLAAIIAGLAVYLALTFYRRMHPEILPGASGAPSHDS